MEIKKKNKPKKIPLKYYGILIAVLIVGMVGYRVAVKIAEGNRKTPPLAYNVGSIILKKQWIPEALSFEGLAEGDPQVFVYAQVGGKFQYNAVQEGSSVQKDQAITFIDRDIIGQQYNLAPVKSPINGIVTKLFFMDKGAPVSTDKPVAEVANPRSIKVVVSVGEDELRRIKKGMPARIYDINNNSISIDASVYSVTPYIESSTLSGSVTVKTPNRNNILMIGMTVGVDISVGKTFAFVAPEQAIITSLDEIYLFVNDNGKARQVNITRGYAYNGMVEVSGAEGNLKEGDEVITEGAFKLNDGDRIKTTPQN